MVFPRKVDLVMPNTVFNIPSTSLFCSASPGCRLGIRDGFREQAFVIRAMFAIVLHGQHHVGIDRNKEAASQQIKYC